jgi:arylsulfatase A-like enzyme
MIESPQKEHRMKTRPSIVLVITDDQGYPALGSSGHPFIQTPNLDAFHEDSVRFTDFHSGTTCAPTRAGLFTGRYCNSTGVWHTIGGRSLLRRDEVSIASRLSSAGYATGLFGKWHLGDEYPYRPQDRGFTTTVCHGGGGISQQPDWWGNDYFNDTYMVNGEPVKFEGYCTNIFFDQGMRFIETNAPHGPFNVDPKYRDLYANNTSSDAYARFLGMCTNIDENFGRLRAHLARLGIEDDTILIFMSDNGQTQVGDPDAEMFNAGMRGFKGSEYEGGHRIPFFLRWKNGDVSGGRDVPQLSAYIDVTPTLLDLTGVSAESSETTGAPTFDGQSLGTLVRGETDGFDWDSRIIVTDTQRVAHPLKWRKSCTMKGKWRLVDRNELYDLTTDLA